MNSLDVRSSTLESNKKISYGTLIFAISSIVGAIIERVYREDPLPGPCRPIYGFGAVLIYCCSFMTRTHGALGVLAGIPLLELITGLLFNSNHELWHYTEHDIAGQICLKETGLLTLLALCLLFGLWSIEDSKNSRRIIGP